MTCKVIKLTQTEPAPTCKSNRKIMNKTRREDCFRLHAFTRFPYSCMRLFGLQCNFLSSTLKEGLSNGVASAPPVIVLGPMHGWQCTLLTYVSLFSVDSQPEHGDANSSSAVDSVSARPSCDLEEPRPKRSCLPTGDESQWDIRLAGE